MDPHSRAPKKNTSHGNEVLPQDTTHLLQRPCYQRGSPCQDPAGNWTTQRSPDDRKEIQSAVVWSCLPFIRSGQNHLSRHSERGKKTRQTEEEVARQHQGMDRPGVRQVPEGSGEQGKREKTSCEITCSAPTTLSSLSDDDNDEKPVSGPLDGPCGQWTGMYCSVNKGCLTRFLEVKWNKWRLVRVCTVPEIYLGLRQKVDFWRYFIDIFLVCCCCWPLISTCLQSFTRPASSQHMHQQLSSVETPTY